MVAGWQGGRYGKLKLASTGKNNDAPITYYARRGNRNFLALWPLTLWFVFRLSTCFLNASVQKSLQMNLITSKWSVKRTRSLVNLHIGCI